MDHVDVPRPADRLSANGVHLESVSGPEMAALRPTIAVTPVGMNRYGDGAWSVRVEVAVVVVFPDGRRVEAKRAVSLRGKQIGRKPHRRRSTP